MLIRTELICPTTDWNQDWLFIDIETTGLSHAHQVAMISFIRFEKEWQLISIMAEGVKEEKDLLMHFSGILRERHLLVHFNGSSFDIPFLKARFRHHGIYSLLENLHHVDLLRYFPKAKLKDIEQSLGFTREDTIDGKTWSRYYKDYQHHIEELFRHNREDVLSMMHMVEKDHALLCFLTLQKIGPNFLESINESKKSLRLRYPKSIDLDLIWVGDLAFLDGEVDEPNARRLLISHSYHYENILYFAQKYLNK